MLQAIKNVGPENMEVWPEKMEVARKYEYGLKGLGRMEEGRLCFGEGQLCFGEGRLYFLFLIYILIVLF